MGIITTTKRTLIIFIAIALINSGCMDEGIKSEKRSGIKYFVILDGNDNSNGSFKSPWRTIEKINGTEINPGDAVYFEGGSTFEGTLRLDSNDSGNMESNVLIGSFGAGKAIIKGGNREGLVVDKCNHLLVKDLVFTGNGRKTGNISDGVLINETTDLTIDNCEISGFQHSGLHIHKAIDATIKHVYAHDNGFSGIHISGTTMNDPVNYDNKNIYIGYCNAENNPGDPTVEKGHSGNGILASSVMGGIIEYCQASDNGWDMPWTGNGPVGIWIWDCTDFVIQHCISHHNKTNPVAADGGGFDFDGGVSNSVIQYCLSHHNEGAGFGLYEFGAAKPWENNIVRYNISQDDGIINGGSVGIWKNDDRGIMRNCEIYNNTFYNSNPEGRSIWLYDNYPGFHFRNNVFVYKKSLLSERVKVKDELFQRNLYWNLEGNKSFENYSSFKEWAESTGKEIMGDSLTGLYQDPGFVNPGALSVTDPEKINSENLSPYKPKSGSPLINNGLNLIELFGLNPGSKDILGSAIPIEAKFDIGAIEYNDQ